jgi:hypothetical protein
MNAHSLVQYFLFRITFATTMNAHSLVFLVQDNLCHDHECSLLEYLLFRITSATTMNAHSSRSHAILTVYMRVAYTDPIGRLQSPHYKGLASRGFVRETEIILPPSVFSIIPLKEQCFLEMNLLCIGWLAFR